MAQAPAKFLEGSLFRHVVVMATSGSVGLMAIFIVDLVDMYFIAQLLDDQLTAAIGYGGVVMMFATAISVGLAAATSAMISQAIGAGKPARERRLRGYCLAYSLAISLITTAVLWIYAKEAVGLFGAQGRVADVAASYLRITLLGLPFLYAMMTGVVIMRAHGDAGRSMRPTLAAAVFNGALDPILIFGFASFEGMGVEGAAIATALSRVFGCVVAIGPVIWRFGGFARVRLRPLVKRAPTFAAIAGPAMLANVANPVGIAIITAMMARYGDAAVAAYSIVGRLTMVVFAVVFALTSAVGPILGQNFGAGRMGRVRGTLTNGLIFLAFYVTCAAVILMLFRSVIADAFHAQGEMRALIYWFCGPLALAFFFNGALYLSSAAFNNLGRPFASTVLSWGRHILGAAPLAFLFSLQIGAPGVLIGEALGGVIFGGLAVWRAYALVAERSLNIIRTSQAA